MKKINELIEKINNLQKKLSNSHELMDNIAQELANAFKNNITKGKDIHGKPFVPRSPEFSNRAGRKILIKTGNLRRSIIVNNVTSNKAVISSNMPYARIHNEGGKIKITDLMREFFLKQQKKSLKKGKELDAFFWGKLANKKTPINIPQRKFMGIGKDAKNLIIKEIKNYLKNKD